MKFNDGHHEELWWETSPDGWRRARTEHDAGNNKTNLMWRCYKLRHHSVTTVRGMMHTAYRQQIPFFSCSRDCGRRGVWPPGNAAIFKIPCARVLARTSKFKHIAVHRRWIAANYLRKIKHEKNTDSQHYTHIDI